MAIGAVRYIESYIDAPKSARFILRKMEDGEYVLQHYHDKWCEDIAFFSSESMEKNRYKDTLQKCRKLMNCSSVLWIEEPSWRFFSGMTDSQVNAWLLGDH